MGNLAEFCQILGKISCPMMVDLGYEILPSVRFFNVMFYLFEG